MSDIITDFAAMTSQELIVATLNTFGHDSVVEIRCLGVGGRKNRTDSGYFDNFSEAAKLTQRYVEDKCTRGVYFVLNEFPPDLLARAANRFGEYATTTTSDSAITMRRWLYVDGDSVRPAGISATEDQVNQSIERISEVAEWLRAHGLGEAITAMSGNGAHCHLPLMLPNDPDSLALITGVLRTLDAEFTDDHVTIDTTVCNAARICRLYGTVARKGDSTADRPHRMARLLHVPDYVQRRTGTVCDVGALRAVAEMTAERPARVRVPASLNGHQPQRRFLMAEYLRDNDIAFRELRGDPVKFMLTRCLFNSDHGGTDAYFFQYDGGSHGYHCSHASCSNNKWSEVKALFPPRPEHFDPPRQPYVRERRQHETDGAGSKSEPEGWPDLIPIAGVDPEPMQASDFPPCVAGMTQAVVDMAEVPAELPGLMALGALATACQKKFRIACDRSHTEPLNLFVCPALPPGERKTAVVQVLTEPLRQWEMMERERLRPIIREIESSRKTAERRVEHLRTKASRTEDSIERDDLQREIDAIERELPSVPALPQLLIDDCTPEHVATMLNRHGERLAIVSDEGGIFDIVAGRYSRGVPNLDVFLQGHAGSPIRVNRGSREPVDLRSPCLTVAVSCQPFVLLEMGENQAFRGRGLLSRFLFAVPKSRLGYRTLQTAEIPPVVRDRWNRLVCRMLDFEQEADDFGNLRSRTIALSQGAYSLWKNEQRTNELDMRPGGAWADNTGWASKYPGAVLRIAGVLHCAICADAGQDPGAIRVAEPTMLSAVTLGRKVKSHSLQAFGMMSLTDDQKFAHRIVEWIRRESITEFTGRDCAVHCNSAGSVRDLDGAFELLADRGWIRLGQRRKPEGGGRPSQPFEVNPAVAQLDDKTDKTRLEGEYLGSDCAQLDDKTDKTRQRVGDRGVLSVLSSVSAQADPTADPVGRPDPAEDDDFLFSFASDPAPF